MTVYFSHRGTEDTENREQILREPCASVREKNSSHSITAGKEVQSTALTVLFFAQRHGGHRESGTNPP
ncbi:MAG: hypothetical protein ACRCUY_08945 [Thermoguttaceae bacterium]